MEVLRLVNHSCAKLLINLASDKTFQRVQDTLTSVNIALWFSLVLCRLATNGIFSETVMMPVMLTNRIKYVRRCASWSKSIEIRSGTSEDRLRQGS